MFRFLTSGESHGKGITVIIEGLPHGVPIQREFVDRELKRRMSGYGRGGRMKIEADSAQFLSGVRKGKSLGSPICIHIRNLDYENWEGIMEPFGEPVAEAVKVLHPRPGHADLAGVQKRGAGDVRDILERASARETAGRVAAGAVAKIFLREFDIHVTSFVTSIGGVKARRTESKKALLQGRDPDKDPLRMIDLMASREARGVIADAAKRGESVGGSFDVMGMGVPPGLGDYTQWDRRLDGKLAKAIVSIPAIKGVEVGEAALSARKGGASVHDKIYEKKGNRFYFGKFRLPYMRRTNNAGGIEGGMSNGEDIVIHCFMKPIPTLTSPLETVSIIDFSQVAAAKERSDICAVPAASVVGESMMALVISECLTEKFGGDSLRDMKIAFEGYLGRICVKDLQD